VGSATYGLRSSIENECDVQKLHEFQDGCLSWCADRFREHLWEVGILILLKIRTWAIISSVLSVQGSSREEQAKLVKLCRSKRTFREFIRWCLFYGMSSRICHLVFVNYKWQEYWWKYERNFHYFPRIRQRSGFAECSYVFRPESWGGTFIPPLWGAI